MTRVVAITLLALAAWPLAARAEHANIDLRVIRLDPNTGASADETTAYADTEPPLGGILPRPLAKVKVNEPLALQFILTNTYPHGENKDVTVRYFVVREEKARQKNLPDLSKGVVTEGRFTLNFKPKSRVGARVSFTLKDPGVYLLRVHTLNTNSDHEHFSAVDLQAE
jgi:hypothetical protein